ncbi:MAG: tRNA (adenosine(37)-N6)-threonylcarbamoyltransferase complex transferase subunit TsaD [Candidatus Omnitrophota bacterium]
MYVLGIETSCDETSASVVENGRQILSCQTSSSIKFHKKYGGIVPEIASRMQLETITMVSDSAIKEAKIRLKDIGLISVTNEPGLLGSLLVGISFAKAVSFGADIPLLGINHLHSHIYAAFLQHLNNKHISLPFIALIVSGGHTSLFYVRDFDKISILGSTLDDACGEAFDKVAKIMGLDYPGGPYIEKLAKDGNPKKIKFPCSDTDAHLNFSFSGIKTAVLYYVNKSMVHSPQSIDKRKNYGLLTMDYGLLCDIAASFQEAVINTLIKKSLLACKTKKINQLIVGGGVAANNRLREKLSEAGKTNNIQVFFPAKEFCMDNAAMVAGLGYRLFKKNRLYCKKS